MLTDFENSIYARTSLLIGDEALEACSGKRVIIFGAGGVGSWCAEGLLRSGVKHLTIVDPDVVNPSNVNRQLEATSLTIGRPKVEALRERLLEINPDADITALRDVYNDENRASFGLETYDYIVDAIDSLKDKISLVLRASETPAGVYSSMGAALKTDPTRIRVAEFRKVRGCPLGAIMRKRMSQAGTWPHKHITCVYDEEVLENLGQAPDEGEDNPLVSKKAQVNGTCAHITAIFGMTIAGLIVQDICRKIAIFEEQH